MSGQVAGQRAFDVIVEFLPVLVGVQVAFGEIVLRMREHLPDGFVVSGTVKADHQDQPGIRY